MEECKISKIFCNYSHASAAQESVCDFTYPAALSALYINLPEQTSPSLSYDRVSSASGANVTLAWLDWAVWNHAVAFYRHK
jgi:hypothetical protein